jgi:hypothetical protein
MGREPLVSVSARLSVTFAFAEATGQTNNPSPGHLLLEVLLLLDCQVSTREGTAGLIRRQGTSISLPLPLAPGYSQLPPPVALVSVFAALPPVSVNLTYPS